jgi:XTP/dITP diphosphohydrolase
MITRLVLATRNRGKVREFRGLFEGVSGLEVISLHDIDKIPDIVEDGATFEENARKKASHVTAATGLLTLADDSGLEVDALDGAPGVYSARFAGDGADDAANNRKLLERLSHVPDARRSARFRCVLALAIPRATDGGEIHIEYGVCEGQIGWSARGNNGFGYDPLFIPRGQTKTMAELSPEEKNRISHRAQALRQMRSYIVSTRSPFVRADR